MAEQRVWEVTLHDQQRLVARVVADVNADEKTLRNLALEQADEHAAVWETVYSETSTTMLDKPASRQL